MAKAPKLTYDPGSARPPEALLGENGNVVFTQLFEPEKRLVPGVAYSVEDLLFRSIAYSDNEAYFMLVGYAQAQFGTDALLDFLQRLGVITVSGDPDNIVSVRGYSSIFRLLYNASLLNQDSSERVLKWLAASTFREGLVAGVPSDVRVAHKFGEFSLPDAKLFQLHDCGVVYYPENPYLLCIMTRGQDVQALAGIIAEISRQVYLEVDSRRL